jgi:uncharacterized membrane protein
MDQYIAIIFISFAGFFLSFYLHHKKKEKKEQFICPLKGKCSEVIHSRYSRFFGIPVELIGMLYYTAVAIGYGLSVASGAESVWLLSILLLLTTGAFAFSLYLTFIQIASLRKLCTWCLLSATFCTVIFGLAISGSIEIVIPFLTEFHTVFVMLHVLAMALGLGAATLTDVFFFKALKDFRISEQEANVLSTISEFIWFALGMVLMTGLALYLPESAALAQSPKFLTKMIIVAVLIVNGAFLNLILQPRLMRISFHKSHDHKAGELRRARMLAFVLGPISIVSWYSAFILGSLRNVTFSFTELLGMYVVLVGVGVIGGRVLEWYYVSKAN